MRPVFAISLLVPVVIGSVASAQPAPAPRPGRTATTPWATDPVPAPAPAPAPAPVPAPPASAAAALPRPVYVRKAPPPSKIVYASAPSYEYTWRMAVTAGSVGGGKVVRSRFTARAGRRLGAFEVALGLARDGQVEFRDSPFTDSDGGTWDDSALTVTAMIPLTTRHWRFAPGLGLSAHRTVVDGPDRESEASYSAAVDTEAALTLAIWRVEIGARLAIAYVGERAAIPYGSGLFDAPGAEVELGLVLGASY